MSVEVRGDGGGWWMFLWKILFVNMGLNRIEISTFFLLLNIFSDCGTKKLLSHRVYSR